MRRPSSKLSGAAAALVGGALVGLSLPPIGAWPVGVAGLGLVLASFAQPWKRRLLAGFLAGLGQFSIGLAWAIQFNDAGYVALVILESGLLALAALLVPRRGPLFLPAGASLLALFEWARDSWPFGGLPLGSAALGQTGGPFQFAARLGGPILVVFAAALAGGGIVRLLLLAGSRRGGGSYQALACLVGAAALAGAGGVAASGVPAGARRLSVALVQGGGRRGLTALQVPPSLVFDAAVRETTKVSGHPSLILWPEDVVGLGAEPFKGSRAEAVLEAIAQRHRATLVAGVTYDVGRTRFRNEVVAISPAGRLVATFEKVHRVPFGEYVPLRGLFKHLANLKAVPRDAIPGHGSGLIRTPAGNFAVLVSYEVFFANRGRSGVRAGGRVILVPTNTSSYSNDQAPSQEIAASRLQALEEDRYLLQVAPTGYSAVVSPSGVVSHRSRLSRPDVIETSVPMLSATTPYADLGELPTLLGAGAVAALGWLLAFGRRDDEL